MGDLFMGFERGNDEDWRYAAMRHSTKTQNDL